MMESSDSERSYARYLRALDRVNKSKMRRSLSKQKRKENRMSAGGSTGARSSLSKETKGQRKNFVCFEEPNDKCEESKSSKSNLVCVAQAKVPAKPTCPAKEGSVRICPTQRDEACQALPSKNQCQCKEGSEKNCSCQCKEAPPPKCQSKATEKSCSCCKCKEGSVSPCRCKASQTASATNLCKCKDNSERSCHCQSMATSEEDKVTGKSSKKDLKESKKKKRKKQKKGKSSKNDSENDDACSCCSCEEEEYAKENKKKKTKKAKSSKKSKKKNQNDSENDDACSCCSCEEENVHRKSKSRSSSKKKQKSQKSNPTSSDSSQKQSSCSCRSDTSQKTSSCSCRSNKKTPPTCACCSCEKPKTCNCCSCKEPPTCSCEEPTNLCCEEAATCQQDESAATSICPDQKPCDKCSMIPEISQKICELQNRLESKVKEDCAQSELLKDICKKVNKLSLTVKTLTNQCKEQKKIAPCPAPPPPPPSPPPQRPKSDPCLEKKVSSTCQFCGDKNLPVLNDLKCELLDVIGKRQFDDIVLTVLLRADNVYHVNIRDLNNGSVLGCLLVTDAAIKDATKFGLFKQILTFFVIDVRNTLKPCESVFGITFEFVPEQRQCGGRSSMDCDRDDIDQRWQSPQHRKNTIAQILGLPVDKLNSVYSITHACKIANVRARFFDHHSKSSQCNYETHCQQNQTGRKRPTETFKSKRSKSLLNIVPNKCDENEFSSRIEALFEIAQSDSKLVLTDYELDYPIQGIEVTSLSDMG